MSARLRGGEKPDVSQKMLLEITPRECSINTFRTGLHKTWGSGLVRQFVATSSCHGNCCQRMSGKLLVPWVPSGNILHLPVVAFGWGTVLWSWRLRLCTDLGSRILGATLLTLLREPNCKRTNRSTSAANCDHITKGKPRQLLLIFEYIWQRCCRLQSVAPCFVLRASQCLTLAYAI